MTRLHNVLAFLLRGWGLTIWSHMGGPVFQHLDIDKIPRTSLISFEFTPHWEIMNYIAQLSEPASVSDVARR